MLEPDCEVASARAFRALAAGALALDAHERGDDTAEAAFRATFRELWPNPEPLLIFLALEATEQAPTRPAPPPTLRASAP
ncbi:MAG: hypothetical protein EP330_04165 [Deltaproteobacteria bacterium]|nr:MAG: hypothetical protein EP330_04165 [Deltaproteobacteria bacterium]